MDVLVGEQLTVPHGSSANFPHNETQGVHVAALEGLKALHVDAETDKQCKRGEYECDATVNDRLSLCHNRILPTPREKRLSAGVDREDGPTNSVLAHIPCCIHIHTLSHLYFLERP